MQRDGARYSRYRDTFLQNDPGSYAAINRAFAEFDATTGLAAIRCPTLVLAGAHDKLRPPATARDVANHVPNAQFEIIDSGHVMPAQAPAEMAEVMMAFYKTMEGGRENA